MKKFTTLAALAIVGLFSQAAHSAELVTNGGFESAVNLNSDGYCYGGVAGLDCGTIEGWSGWAPVIVDKDSTPWGSPSTLGGFDASFGNQVAALQNSYVFEQEVSGAGGSYTLSWWESGRMGTDPQTYNVSFGGTQLHPTFSTPAGRGWVQQVLTFSATGGAQVLSFTGTSSNATVFLDNISLTGAPLVSAVPEPESAAMLFAGLGVLGAMVRRQRKAA